MKQCCNDDCINAKGCEQKAKERWSREPSLFVMVFSNLLFIASVVIFLGIIFEVL